MASLKLTFEEEGKLLEFRDRVGKICPKPDGYLLTWLRAADLDILKAEKMLRRHLVWRKNNEVDDLVRWQPPKVYFPFLDSGVDKDGTPVMVLPFGKWEVRNVVESGDFWPLATFILSSVEKVVKHYSSKNVYDGVAIVDFDGFEYRQIAQRMVIVGFPEFFRIFLANYPVLIKALYVINAPKIFNYVFSLVKPALTAHVLDRIQIFGPDKSTWQEAVFKNIDRSQIPKYWGGTKTGEDEYCSDSWYYGPLPQNFFRKTRVLMDDYGMEWYVIHIPAGEKFSYQYSLGKKEQGQLTWRFYTASHNISFTIRFNDAEELVPLGKVDSHSQTIEGSLTLTKAGKYTVIFDNSHSKLRTKTLMCDVQLEKSG